MSIRQLSIFLENRVGRLADITQMLGDASVDILAISVADTKDFGILRLIVDNPDKAESALRANEVICRTDEVTIVGVDGCPGGLGKILSLMNDAKINVEYMYAIAQSKSAHPLMVFRFSDNQSASAALKAAGIDIIDTL